MPGEGLPWPIHICRCVFGPVRENLLPSAPILALDAISPTSVRDSSLSYAIPLQVLTFKGAKNAVTPLMCVPAGTVAWQYLQTGGKVGVSLFCIAGGTRIPCITHLMCVSARSVA